MPGAIQKELWSDLQIVQLVLHLGVLRQGQPVNGGQLLLLPGLGLLSKKY